MGIHEDQLNELEFKELYKFCISRTKQTYIFLNVNIKYFSVINYTHGTDVGDEVIKAVYEALKNSLKDNEYITRSKADTFYLLICSTADELDNRMKSFFESVEAINMVPLEHPLRLSVGAYILTDKSKCFHQIVGNSNYARRTSRMYYEDVSCYEVYDILKKNKREKEYILIDTIQSAFKHDDLIVVLQPKISLENDKIIAAEALVRIRQQNGELMKASEFIPFLEKIGLIKDVDLFVFDTVLQFLEKRKMNNKELFPISINLSKSHFTDENFFEEYFLPIFQNYHIDKKYIELEISENMMIDNENRIRKIVHKIRKYGFECSLDDFGSGYSSFMTMANLPVSTVKLDRNLFNQSDIKRSHTIIKGIIKIAKELNMKIVAEGIETDEQVLFLKNEKCDMVQSFRFGMPMLFEQFEKLIDSVD